jgi:Na+(H+)/acetate symporter ActP
MARARTAGDEQQFAKASQEFTRQEAEARAVRNDTLALIRDTTGDPNYNDVNYVFPTFITTQLPVGLVGLLIAAILAAAMSAVGGELTAVSTASVIDFYRRFVKKEASDSHYVNVSRVATVILVIAAAIVAALLTSIKSGWEFVLELGAGTGIIYLLRWYWWRINAWSEIAAMVTAMAVSLSLRGWQALADAGRASAPFTGSGPVIFAKSALTTTLFTTVISLTVTMLTQPESNDILVRFYRKVRPDVRGWKPVAHLAPEVKETRDLGRNLIAWILGCGMVYLALFGMGKLIMKEPGLGLLLLVGSAVCAALLYWDQSSRGWGAESGEEAPAAVLKH